MNAVSSTLQAAIASGSPQRVLLEFYKKPNGQAYSPVATMSNEDLSQGFELTEYFNSETDLTVGLCPSAEFKFGLFNDDSFQYEDFDFGTFRAWLGARIDSGTPASGAKTKTWTGGKFPGLYEFTPLGVFIAEKPNIIRKQIVTVTANDQMILFDQDMPGGLLTYPITLANMASALCGHVGVTLKSSAFLNNSLSIAEEPEDFKDATMREVIGWIAEAACSIARFTRDGKLEFAWFDTANRTYDEHDYSDFSPAWYETRAIDKLVIRNSDADTEYVGGSGSNSYYIQDNPFLRQGGSGVGAPTITRQPTSRKGRANSIVSLSVVAENAVQYQWQRKTASGSAWGNVPTNEYTNSATSAMRFTLTANTAAYQYRCHISNAAGSVDSNAVTATITA